MRSKKLLLAAAIFAAVLTGGGGLSPQVSASDTASSATGQTQDYGGLPEGPGRGIVFGLCQACHSLALVKQQGLNRDAWEETLVWMVEEQEMPSLDPASLKLVLDYLTHNFGRESASKAKTP